MFATALLIVADDPLDKAEKIAERPVLIGQMPLERQIGAIELQQKPGIDDRLVFLLEGGADIVEIGLLGLVMLVLHRAGDDAGRGCGQERLGEMRPGLIECRAEIGAFGLDPAAAEIAHRVDRLGRPHIADRLAGGELFFHDPFEDRIAQRVGAGAALPRPAKPAHAVADVQEKTLALLFAVVADVDARRGLLADNPAQCLLSQPVELCRIDQFAARPGYMEPGQLRRSRQAAGVGRQNPFIAAAHRRSFRSELRLFPEFTAKAAEGQNRDRE